MRILPDYALWRAHLPKQTSATSWSILLCQRWRFYGEADQRVPLSAAEDLHTRIPGSRLVVMPGVGHQSNMDAPDLFNHEVRSFLRSLDP
jgi:pimeloyl-ACP methyl ester carboxylesterase